MVGSQLPSPLDVPSFLWPVPPGSPHIPHAINSCLSRSDGRKGKYRGILLRPGFCQPYPIPDMPLCSQEPVGGWQAAQRQGRIAAYRGSRVIHRFPLWGSTEGTNQFSSSCVSPATVNSNRDWQWLPSKTGTDSPGCPVPSALTSSCAGNRSCPTCLLKSTPATSSTQPAAAHRASVFLCF